MAEKKNKLVETIVEGMLEKKAYDVVTLDMAKIPNAICNFFVICHADSSRTSLDERRTHKFTMDFVRLW